MAHRGRAIGRSRLAEALLEHYRVELVVFPSAGPETFCYALSEAWSAGRPGLVPPIGALHERVQASGAGWAMRDSTDTDAVLDDIVSILRPESRTDLAHKQALARAAHVASVREMANATEEVYHDVLPDRADADAAPLAKATLHAALQAALRVNTNGDHRRRWHWDYWLLQLAHLGLRVRYTLPGRWLYRVVPVRWQRLLKRRLLAR